MTFLKDPLGWSITDRMEEDKGRKEGGNTIQERDDGLNQPVVIWRGIVRSDGTLDIF